MATQQFNNERKKKIIKWLGGSDRAKTFASSADLLVKHFSNPATMLEESFFNRYYLCLDRVANSANLLANFLSQEPHNADGFILDEALSEAQIQQAALTHIASSFFKHGDNVFASIEEALPHLRKISDFLFELEGNIRRDSRQINKYVTKTKKKDTVLDRFSNSIIIAFLVDMARLPVITETNNDLKALEEIFRCFGYDKSDGLIKLLKKHVKIRRDAISGVDVG